MRHPEEYRVIGHFALAGAGHAWCEHCKNPVFDQAVFGRDPVLRQRARRGWIVLTDTMYMVRGPDGERQVCRPCMERCAFGRHDEDDDGEALPPSRGVLMSALAAEGRRMRRLTE